MEGEEDSKLPVSFIPATKVWAWLALELRLLPDVLFAVQLLNGALASLPLTQESQAIVRKDLQELDLALGNRLINANDAELRELETMPDILEALGLHISRIALLYTMGYAHVLREDGSLPPEETDERVLDQMSMLASQPVAKRTAGPLILNSAGAQTTSSTILGMTVEIASEGGDLSLIVVQALLGSLEAFFATTIEQRVVPHTEKIRIRVIESAPVAEPAFDMDDIRMSATLTWPSTLSPAGVQQQSTVQPFITQVISRILATAFVIDDAESLIRTLYIDEAVQNRIAMIIAAGTSYHRVAGRDLSRLGDWKEAIHSSYAPRFPRPTLRRIELSRPETEDSEEEDEAAGEGHGFKARDHRALAVRSVIDVHAWDKARWKGAGYVQFAPTRPPALALLFENREGATGIFERWRDRFGPYDEKEEIRLALIRDISPTESYHYAVQVTSKLPDLDEVEPNQAFVTASRTLVMEPSSGASLEMFLSLYRQFRAYYLIPAILANGTPEWLPNLAILKRDLTVKSASEIGEHDIEGIALRQIRQREIEEN
jgi:hypothetical protein